MTDSWETLDRIESDEGRLELCRRGESEFLITIDDGTLMSTTSTSSEEGLATLGCAAMGQRQHPQLLIGGLGLGITLRTSLDCLPVSAKVTVAEINSPVVQWCHGLAAKASDHALEDPRVTVVVEDVREVIRTSRQRWDCILLDLYEGPHSQSQGLSDHCYTLKAMKHAIGALKNGGVYAIWAEGHDPPFERRFRLAGFRDVQAKHLAKGEGDHVVYLAHK